MWKRCKSLFEKWRNPYKKEELFEIKGQKYVMRQATPDDIKEILAVQRDVYYGEAPWTKSTFQLEFRSPIPHLYLVIVCQNKIVAYIGCRVQEKEAHITNLAVHSAYQGNQLSKRMLQEVEGFAKKKRARQISLEVRFDNKVAQSVYRKYGFESKRILQEYYPEDGEDGIRMVYQLEKKHDLHIRKSTSPQGD